MSIFEEKKIVIRLPRLEWNSLFNLRVAGAVLFFLCFAIMGYWYYSVRPFLWIPTAHVEAFSVSLYSDISGKITKINFEEGDLVHKGQPIFSLDDNSLLDRKKEIERSIHLLNEQILQQKIRMEKGMQEYLAATNELDLGMGSQDGIQSHLAILEEAQNLHEKANEELKKANANLASLEIEVNKLSFSASFDAIILKKMKQEGSYTAVGDPIILLADPNRIWIDVSIPEKEIGRIVLGTPARVQLLAYPGKEWQGKVDWIGPATHSKIFSVPFFEEQETITVKIGLEKTDFSLKPGLSAQVGFRVRH